MDSGSLMLPPTNSVWPAVRDGTEGRWSGSKGTLTADTQKGNRPSFGGAAEPEVAERLYEDFCTALAALGVLVEAGVFGARMRVELANDGPVTIIFGESGTGTRTVEVEISPGKTMRVEGLQRDRRQRNDLRVTLPDGRIVFAYGRRPAEDGWEVHFADNSNITIGPDLGSSLAFLMGYERAWEDPPERLDRLTDAVS